MVNSKDYKDKNEYKKALRSSFSDTGKKPPVREVSKKKKLIKRSITIPLTIFLITGTYLMGICDKKKSGYDEECKGRSRA